MDLYKAIRTLYDEKERLDKLIQSIEQLQARGETGLRSAVRGKRGRKRMSPAERKEVSERMKKYWASRKKHSEAPARPEMAMAATQDVRI